MARLREFYKDTVVPELVKQFGYKSVMEVPRIEKITLNMIKLINQYQHSNMKVEGIKNNQILIKDE